MVGIRHSKKASNYVSTHTAITETVRIIIYYLLFIIYYLLFHDVAILAEVKIAFFSLKALKVRTSLVDFGVKKSKIENQHQGLLRITNAHSQ
jgi:hypothetical protein